MSETTPHTTNDACELLLDYVYGELDEARKRTFEEHLPGCARCQQEVASFGRVRTAAKLMMPSVEPSAQLGGALHAQLMHAAAQRKPRRGVLLAFPRKMMQHPALSAAAMFALVGGAIAINWSRGKMAMPAAEQSPAAERSIDTPKSTEVATATPKAPAGEPMVPEPKAKEQAGEQAEAKPDVKLAQGTKNEASFKGGADKAAASTGDQTRIALETPSGRLDVQRPVAHRATPSPKKEAPAKMKTIAVDGKSGKLDSLDDGTLAAVPKDEGGRAGLSNGVVGGAGGVTSGGGGRFADAENAKSSAPQELDRNKVAEKAPARDLAKQQHGYAVGAPAPSTPQSSTSTGQQQWRANNGPAAAPPPPTAATAPATEREGAYYGRSQAQSQPAPVTVQKPAAQTRNYDSVRKNADEWAKTGRCDEAIKMYTELEKANQYISPTERVGWVRCLTQKGREEEARQRLDDLKQEKRLTPAQLQNAERELNDSRRRVESKAKASKKAPAAADRAPVETQQQRAEEPAPAQASPPDSTNTKVKKPAY
jgi:anti-sigma factor RsiW